MANKIRGRNEGSIFQRENGSWRGQVSVDGRRLSKTCKTKAEVQTWIRQMQRQQELGYELQAGRVLMSEYLAQWMETMKLTLQPKTLDQYQHTVTKHLLPRIGKKKLNEIKPIQIERLYADMITDGLGIRTIRIVHAVLHKAFEKAVHLRILAYNPAHGVTLPRYKPEEMTVLDESQVAIFLVAAQESPFRALYHLAVITGMRQGELFGLKWSDVGWTNGTIAVQRQVQYLRGRGRYFQEPKTRRGRRTIKVGEGVLHALRQHKERQNMQKAFAGDRWQELGLIFPSSTGTMMDASNLRLDFKRILKAAGLPNIRFHDLRHTAASLMLNHGIPVMVVSGMLGHAKPSITLDIYGHLLTDAQTDAARIMDELVTPVRVQFSAEKSSVSNITS